MLARAAAAAVVLFLALAAPASAAGPVLGARGLFPNGTGWGTVRPVTLFNGGVPSGLIDDIRWTGWGRDVARGRGRKPTYRPGGGYYRRRVAVQLKATRLATCPGAEAVPAYTRLLVRSRVKPGGRYGDWFPGTLDLCDWRARPHRCGRVVFSPNSEYMASRITAWDTSCARARRVARASRRVRVKPRDASYRARFAGFVCNGYSLGSRLPTISWSCSRGTAVVTFERS